MALRYTDAICFDATRADDKLWAQLHEHFTDPELVELGSFVGYIIGARRWIDTLGIVHGEFMAESTVGLSPEAAAAVLERSGKSTD
ncbi:MAG: hypothetical protein ACRDY3_03130 [Acidimicrobiales bacterium]